MDDFTTRLREEWGDRLLTVLPATLSRNGDSGNGHGSGHGSGAGAGSSGGAHARLK